MTQNATFISKFAELGNNLALSKETGYVVQNLTHGDYTFVEGIPSDRGGKIKWEGLLNIYGTLHSHYNGLAHMFSPEDIGFMADIIHGLQSADPGNFFTGVYTPAGPYILKVTNISQFINFISKRLFPVAKKKKWFQNNEDLFRFGANPQNKFNEVGILQALGFNSGLTLYRGNDECTEWRPLSLDITPNTTNVSVGSPCQ